MAVKNPMSFLRAGLSKCFVAGQTLNTFLLTGISNIITFLIKKKNIVAVTSNIYD